MILEKPTLVKNPEGVQEEKKETEGIY